MNDIKKELAGALARAYTTDRNSHKELDSILIEDMVTELIPIVDRKLKEARIDELKKFKKRWLNRESVGYLDEFNNRITELEK